MTKLPHQGIVAWIDPVSYYPVNDLVDHLFFKGIHPCLCMLDGITDVRNFGAIARSAEVMGIHGLVVPQKNTAPINEESIRSSAGALLKIPVCRVKSMTQTIHELKELGFTIICCAMKEGKEIRLAELAKPVVFILGAEGDGVSERLSELADETVFIPQKGTIDSLNVSVASGIIFYEWMLQNNS
jgi:23S rRNA (guanosine2251-2'-O)-methyltransferase